ncbi:hypothetical protein [Bacillus suaedae]|uniref:Uncharacterized protein n=1 Tax=Halalkalibacter suaedae TaxID=2822140 RepID=A0A940WY60_9BACI|nr:hypothetical protein [Bacillus suaedae]MBP3950640.1 hypothetical protein [Bacillus suaedae]
MKLKWSAITAIFVTMLFIPIQVLAAGGGAAEGAHEEPSGLLMTSLIILSFATLIFLVFLELRDNG